MQPPSLMSATVLAPRIMPAFAADSSDNSIFGHTHAPFSLPTRTSADKPPAGREYAEKQPNGDIATMNGKLANGPVMQSVPNGRPIQPSASDKRISQTDGPANAPKRWSVDSQSPYKSPESRGNSGERSSRDDGYFASVYSSEMQDGCRTTHVKLGTLSSTDGTKEARRDFNPLKYDSDLKNAQPPNPQANQTNLQIPNAPSTYRVSSPPAFNHSSPDPAQQPYRLQHRHTLEVPKVSTSRARDMQSQNNADDVATASGRFSPNTPTRRRGSMSLARRATRSIHSDMHLDEVPQDEDAARWAEHIRQKRASKRKRKEDEDDDRVVVGTKVDQNHVNWVTAYNMLTGIRFTVSRTNAKMDRELTDADFEAKHKFSFDMYVPSELSFSSFSLFNFSCGCPRSANS